MRVNSTTRRGSAKTLLVFSVMLLFCAGFVLPAAAQSISGTVFEDPNYPGYAIGRNLGASGTAGIDGAIVELYYKGNLVATTTTSSIPATLGQYTFNTTNYASMRTNRTYVVRASADGGNLVSGRATTGAAGTPVPVQTFRTDCSTGACVPVTDHVGGEIPASADPAVVTTIGAAIPAAQSLTTVKDPNNLTGVNFGFNFDLIVNTNATGQGSLAQFITNSNVLSGADTAIFMISDNKAHSGMIVTYVSLLTGTTNGSVFRIIAGSMPTVTDANTTIDAATSVIANLGSNPNTGTYGSVGITLGAGSAAQSLSQWTGATAPPVEIMSSAGDQQWQLTGAGDEVRGFALAQFTLYLTGNGAIAQDNIVGMHADETFTNPTIGAETLYYGIQLGGGSGIVINHNLVAVNDSGIRRENVSASATIIEYNEVDLPSGGHGTTYDGILMVGPGTFAGDTIQYNYVHNQRGGGIEVGFSGAPNTFMSGEKIQYNTVRYNGWVLNGTGPKSSTYTYNTPSAEPMNIAVWGVQSGSTVFVTNNLVSNAGGVGVLIENAYGFTISQNSIYQSGYSTSYKAAQGPGISLYNSNVDPNGFGTSLGISPNSGVLNPAMPNNFMNYPVITLATYNGVSLHVKGYVGGSTNLAIANASVELFIADNTDNNQNGNIFQGDGQSVAHGEGLTYIYTLTADSTGLFDVTIPKASLKFGVAVGTILTSTATDALSGSTSEFGANVTVLANAVTISGYVYLDANHNGNMDSGEGWQNGTQVYVSLWNGVTQLGTTQTVPTGSLADTGFYSFDNISNPAGGNYTIVLSTTAMPTGIGSAGVPAGYISINPGTATISVTLASSSGVAMNMNFGLFHGLTVSGNVFKDNGVGTLGVANDGKLNGTEPGLPNVLLLAKDSFSVTLDKETTDGAGAYTLWLPAIDSSANAVGLVSFTLSQVGGYTATGQNDPGTPATNGTYLPATFVFTFTPNFATYGAVYTKVNFGFIQSGNIFAPNGQQTTVPGSIAIYSHQYTSVTGGSVTFTETTVPGPPSLPSLTNYFNELLYLDSTSNCTGKLSSATYLAWGTAVPLPAGGGAVCVFMKEMVSAAASFGMQNSVTINATFSYAGSAPALLTTRLIVTDITMLDTQSSGVLQLVKSTYIDTSCATQACICLNPGSPAYSNATQSALSGNCIKYQIQATNAGASALSGLTINDTVPPYTTMQSGTPFSAVGSSCTGLVVGAITTPATGSLQAAFTGTMPAGCVATFVYEVKLN